MELAAKGIITPNEWTIPIMTEEREDTCTVCLEDSKQDFVMTTCGHTVCYNCLKELLKNKSGNCCPVCRRTDWY